MIAADAAPAATSARVQAVTSFRPRRFLELLDGGVALVRRHARAVAVLVVVFVVPVQVVTAVLLPRWSTDPSATTGSPVPSLALLTDGALLTGGGLRSVALALLQSLPVVFVAAGCTHLAVADRRGLVLSSGTVVRRVCSRSGSLLVAWVLQRLAYVVGACGSVLWLPVMALGLVIAPAVAAERLGPWAAVRRSWSLTGTRFWASLGFALGSGAVATLMAVAFTLVPTVVTAFGGPGGGALQQAAAVAAQLIQVPFVAAATSLYYLELRVRTEGLDLELAAEQAFGRAAG